jgi:hypothetical protein
MRLLWSVGLLGAIVALGGCGSQAVVTGKITYKKEPLTTGEVSFIASDGKSRSGLISPDGTYKIVDAPLGSVVIVVVAKQLAGKVEKGDPLSAKPKGGRAAQMKSAIPEKYNDPKTSGLTYTVTSGRQTRDIDLEE